MVSRSQRTPVFSVCACFFMGSKTAAGMGWEWESSTFLTTVLKSSCSLGLSFSSRNRKTIANSRQNQGSSLALSHSKIASILRAMIILSNDCSIAGGTNTIPSFKTRSKTKNSLLSYMKKCRKLETKVETMSKNHLAGKKLFFANKLIILVYVRIKKGMAMLGYGMSTSTIGTRSTWVQNYYTINYHVIYYLFSVVIVIIDMSTSGSIDLICGPMFSGKTQHLLTKLRRYHHATKPCILVIPNMNPASPPSSGSPKSPFKVLEIGYGCLSPIWETLTQYQVIGIDKGHIFNDLVEVCEGLAEMGKTVIVAGLDATWERKPFQNVVRLLPIAETLTKLMAVCVDCTSDAPYTFRSEEEGHHIYKPVCRKCYFANCSSS